MDPGRSEGSVMLGTMSIGLWVDKSCKDSSAGTSLSAPRGNFSRVTFASLLVKDCPVVVSTPISEPTIEVSLSSKSFGVPIEIPISEWD